MRLYEITQRMLEAYDARIVKVRQSDDFEAMPVSRFNRLLIEAARDAGIAADLPEDLLDCKPSEVIALTQRVVEHIAAAKAPADPN